MFNSVAIAAKQLQDRIKVKKILIVDWVRHTKQYLPLWIYFPFPFIAFVDLHISTY